MEIEKEILIGKNIICLYIDAKLFELKKYFILILCSENLIIIVSND